MADLEGVRLCESCMNVVALRNRPLPQLPDDVLLAVFRWLPWRALLRSVRSVCRRWRGLALQPSLWSCRALSGKSTNKFEFRAVMRLVPCLYSLEFEEFDAESVDTYDAACRTNCAVTKLTLVFPEEGVSATILLIFGRVLQRQLDLGRLQALLLRRIPRQGAENVLGVALSGNFTELSISVSSKANEEEPLKAPLTVFPKFPPVKTFRYYSATKDPMLECLLTAFSPTLESVKLLDTALTDRALELVNKCHRLRAAEIPYHEHLPGLRACPLLTDLTLDLLNPSRTELVSFFRGAVQLTKLSLPKLCDRDVPPQETDAMALLTALSSSGRSALRELRMDCMEPNDDSHLSVCELPAFLRGLPLLHTLSVEIMPPLCCLDEITPSIAPSLRLLRFTFTGEPAGCMCHGGSCSLRTMYELVQRNPQLHVSGLFYYHQCYEWIRAGFYAPCECCEEGIHPLSGKVTKHCSLYGHSAAHECEAASEHRDPGPCPVCDECAHEWIFVEKDTIPCLI